MTQLIPQEENALDRDAAGVFSVELGDETFAFRRVRFDDRKVVGLQIAEAAGAHPIEAFAILRHLRSGELESIRPAEPVDLGEEGVERFFVIRGDDLHRFTVEGLSMEWPKAKLAAKNIKFLAKAAEGQVLVAAGRPGRVAPGPVHTLSPSRSRIEPASNSASRSTPTPSGISPPPP